MTKTFRDYDRENDLQEGRKEGEFNTVYNFIKQGLVTVEQAAKSIGLTKEQLLDTFKEYNFISNNRKRLTRSPTNK